MGLPQPTTSGLTLLPVDCFAQIARQPGSIWLDSSLTRGDWGGRSIMAADPTGEIRLSGNEGYRRRPDGNEVERCDREAILSELEEIRHDPRRMAIGYVSYEACLPWLGLHSTCPASRLPEIR